MKLNDLLLMDDRYLIEKYRNYLSKQELRQLLIVNRQYLNDYGRLEINQHSFDRILEEFCELSDFSKDDFEELLELFYYLRDDMSENISDEQIIILMKKIYVGKCFGSIEILRTEMLELLDRIRFSVEKGECLDDEFNRR
ncbi:MAG: DUF6323 family protein [Erysipelotrichia bacterium]|nr:DUF6323 family protein [Erysipelotrichia bacterium]